MVTVSKTAKPGEIPKGIPNHPHTLQSGMLGSQSPVTDEPSQVKNNLDQVRQPTGDGGVAGGRIPPVGATGNEPAELPPTEAAKRYNEDIRLGQQANSRVNMTPNPDKKMVLMKLKRHYVPKGSYELVGDVPEPALAGTGFKNKLLAGTSVMLEADEAREVLKAEIAARGDDF